MKTAMQKGSPIADVATASPTKNRVPRWVMPLVKFLIIATDGIIATASFLFAFWIREGEPILSETAWAWSKAFVPYAGILYFAIFVRISMLAYQGVLRLHGAFSYAREAIRVFKAAAVSSLLIISWAFLFRGGFAFRDFSYSRGVFVLDFIFALTGLLVFHLVLRYLQSVARQRDINLIPTLVVGSGDEAARTISTLAERPELGYRVVGLISGSSHLKENYEVPHLGSLEVLPQIVTRLAIREVIIADENISGEELFETMMKIGRNQRVEFRLAPGLFGLLPQKTSIEQIGVLPMIRLFCEPLSDVERFVKRAFDIIISLFAITATLPVMALIAIWIKLDSRGRILFRQERVGMDGRIFLCYKFRTMYEDADPGIHREAYLRNINSQTVCKQTEDEKTVFGKVENDPRITRAGRILRRTSLDELPQLFNVLRGEMSIVGPRPPIPYEVENYAPWHRRRLDMRPGITGLWQVSGRSRIPFEEMVKIDLYYIENWSIWLDLKIILLTIPAVFRGDGAQ